MTLLKTTVAIILNLYAIFAYAKTENHTITVLDSSNNPLPNAIISFNSLSPLSATKKPKLMDQENYQFIPKVLVVAKDQPVQFPNSDRIRHHVYSFSKPKVFEIKLFKGNATDNIIFDKPGLVVLGCNIHDSMVGYIYITDKKYATKTNSDGVATLTQKPPQKVSLWHSKLSNNINEQIEVVLDKTSDKSWQIKLNQKIKNEKEKERFGSGFY